MKIKMLVHVKGPVNGVRMGPYVKGQEYEVPGEIPQDQAHLFIGSAMAEEVPPPPPPDEDATP